MNSNKHLSSESNIYFFNEDISFVLKDKKKLTSWLLDCATKEKVIIGELNYIFCSDHYLLEINKKHLQHNYFTDIITFPLQAGPFMNADIYISIERVKENAKNLGIIFRDELHRVMAHGLLHLCGYGDKSSKQIKKMREMEDRWLEKRQ